MLVASSKRGRPEARRRKWGELHDPAQAGKNPVEEKATEDIFKLKELKRFFPDLECQ